MRKKLHTTGNVFPMPVLMVATYNEDGSVDFHHLGNFKLVEKGDILSALKPAVKCVP